MLSRIAIAAFLSAAVLFAQALPYPWFIYYDGTYKGTSKSTFRKMLDLDQEEGIRVSSLLNLPATCGGKILLRYVPDAHTSTGGLPLYLCGPGDVWRQLGYQADGTGYFRVHCDQPGVCLVGPETAVVPSLPVPNAWTGANDFSNASSLILK